MRYLKAALHPEKEVHKVACCKIHLKKHKGNMPKSDMQKNMSNLHDLGTAVENIAKTSCLTVKRKG